MRTKVRTNMTMMWTLAAVLLLLTHLVEAGVASAATDQYDPRRDPNYTHEASETAPINWEAVWGLMREFEARAHANVGRNQPPSHFAVPQPWHDVQEVPSPGATPPISGAVGYGGPFYGYDPWLPGWWETSPRIPWWSLIPFKKDHHRHHRQHEAKGDHHRW